MRVAALIGTFLGVGHIRPAPGTWGSLAALPLIWALHQLGGPWLVLAGIVALFAVGTWATADVIRDGDDHDPSEIVIDEVVGQALAILPVSVGAYGVGVDVLTLYPGWILGFALTIFEALIQFLQAYVFTLLAASYIGGALADEH